MLSPGGTEEDAKRPNRERENLVGERTRIDTELLKRAFLGWLRGEPRHCSMAKIPTSDAAAE